MVGALFLFFAATSQLSSPGDYIFRPFKSNTDAASWISGRIMGVNPDYWYLRAEDVAFIDEGWGERRAFSGRAFPSSVTYNIVSNTVLKKATWGGRLSGGIYIATNQVPRAPGIYKYSGSASNFIIGDPCTITNAFTTSAPPLNGPPLTRASVVSNFVMFAKVKQIVYDNGVSRGGVTIRERRNYVSPIYTQDGYPDECNWELSVYENVYTNYYSSGSDYKLSRYFWKNARRGEVRTEGGWEYPMSPTEVGTDETERIVTNAVARYDLGIPTELATTGGVDRVEAVRMFQAFQVQWSRSWDHGGGESGSSNRTYYVLLARDATRIDKTGANVVAEIDYSVESIAADALGIENLPTPMTFTTSNVPEPEPDGDWYVLDKSETRSVELSVIGGGIAVVTCRFKTDVSSGTSGGGS